MRNIRYLILIPFFLVHTDNVSSVLLSDEKNKNQSELEEILRKCDEYCERAKSSALFFVCQEKIKEEFSTPSRGISVSTTVSPEGRRVRTISPALKKERNEYIYDYQLIKKGSDIKESRTLIEENGEERYEKDAPLKTRRFYSLRSVYGPVGFLSREFQEQYDYKLKKGDKVEGREAYVIEASPKKMMEGKPNYGKLWIDKEDFSVLKIEIAQESLAGYEDFIKKIKKQGFQPIFTTTHYYGVEKKGIRFPSKTVFREVYRPLRGIISKTVIEYSNYRFFTVEYEVKHE